MKLGIGGHGGAVHSEDDIVSGVGDGAISEVRVRATLTMEDSSDDMGDHDEDCEGCALCRPARTKKSRARRVTKVPRFVDYV